MSKQSSGAVQSTLSGTYLVLDGRRSPGTLWSRASRVMSGTWRPLAAQRDIRVAGSQELRNLRKHLRFLEAMLQDNGESRLADISKRMGVRSNYATKYKSCLLERGVIADRGHGYLAFDLPGSRDYIAER